MEQKNDDFVRIFENHAFEGGAGAGISGNDLKALSSAECINQGAVDGLFATIFNKMAPAVQWFPTTLTGKLLGGRASVSRYFAKARPKINIFHAEARYVLFPIYLPGHFALIIVNHTTHEITSYDSLYGPSNEKLLQKYANAIRDLLKDEAQAQGLAETEWTIVMDGAQRYNLPRQINGVDCGRYVTQIALCRTADEPIPLSLLTPELLASSRTFLAISLAERSFPALSSIYTACTSNTTRKTTNKRSARPSKKSRKSRENSDHSCNDSSDDEDGENYVCSLVSQAKEQHSTQTRGSSRPARSAATKATKALAITNQDLDYDREPDLLYEQQVLR
jgi:hypothetical protein